MIDFFDGWFEEKATLKSIRTKPQTSVLVLSVTACQTSTSPLLEMLCPMILSIIFNKEIWMLLQPQRAFHSVRLADELHPWDWGQYSRFVCFYLLRLSEMLQLLWLDESLARLQQKIMPFYCHLVVTAIRFKTNAQVGSTQLPLHWNSILALTPLTANMFSNTRCHCKTKCQ